MGTPQRLVGQFHDPGRQAQADEVEQGKGGQRLAVAVSCVLDDRQFAGVAEDLVEGEGGVALGGDDHLGAVGRVLVRDVGVAGDAFVQKYLERARAVRERPRTGSRRPSDEDRVPPPQARADLVVVGVDDGRVGRPQGLLA